MDESFTRYDPVFDPIFRCRARIGLEKIMPDAGNDWEDVFFWNCDNLSRVKCMGHLVNLS